MTAVPHTLVNGTPTALLDVLDRGLRYGDGLFETIAAVQGELRFWERHMARLQAGCKRLHLPPPDQQQLRAEALHVLQEPGSWVVKIMLTRGQGGRGYQPGAHPETTRIVQCLPWPDYPQEWASKGVRLGLSTVPLGQNPLLAGIKHLNRLEQVLASREMTPEVEELLLLDLAGNVIEGTRSNLFMARDGVLHTADLQRCGVAGILRSVVLDLCHAAKIPCEVRPLAQNDLLQADEIFMTSSLIGIWPVREFAGKNYTVGPLSQRLQNKLATAAPGEQWYP